MKKIKFSLTALALIVAIAGTATANANSKEVDPCSKIDPKHIACPNDWIVECCEEPDMIWNEPFPL
ncbi:hypothetical protein [Niastella sp. OAS944]|uniref:hypothetical protein n=1 Tax=Niastella sp. OAS944 TaxID=2664089 RepID=UPI00348811C2|nr:uncharacterized protein YxeA [Chitinophagaceae bacterium OAS944]